MEKVPASVRSNVLILVHTRAKLDRFYFFNQTITSRTYSTGRYWRCTPSPHWKIPGAQKDTLDSPNVVL
jgi:hypothetical protein